MDLKNMPRDDLLAYVRSIINGQDVSLRRKTMVEGINYYEGRQTIDHKQRMAIGRDGRPRVITNLPNTRWKDNQYSKLVDQKVNYMLSEVPSISSDNETLRKELLNLFDMRFMRTLTYIAQDAFNTNNAWLYVMTDGEKLKFKKMDPLEITPIWEDNTKESLKGVVRQWSRDSWNSERKIIETVNYIELYIEDGVITWEKNRGNYELKEDLKPYLNQGEKAYNWGKIPFIYFRYTRTGQTLLERVKSLQDGINTILSNFGDNMLEDPRNTILVLKGYDGEDLGEFRQQLATYSTVKVTEDEFGKGDVSTLEINVSKDNYESVLRILKEKLIENGRGVDAKSSFLGRNPNQMDIMSMYTDIELDCNNIEKEFQASFEYLQGFIKQVKNINQDELAEIKFKRNLLVNQAEKINMLVQSRGLLSDVTLLGEHPLVDDPEKEIQLRDEEIMKRFDDRVFPRSIDNANTEEEV